jgi:hypothetical protein
MILRASACHPERSSLGAPIERQRDWGKWSEGSASHEAGLFQVLCKTTNLCLRDCRKKLVKLARAVVDSTSRKAGPSLRLPHSRGAPNALRSG